MKIIRWFKALFSLVDIAGELVDLHDRVTIMNRTLSGMVETHKALTDVHVDVSYSKYESNHIIVIGHYQGKDYVRTYTVPGGSLNDLVGHLRRLEKTVGRLGRFDCHPTMRYVIDRELNL